MSRTNTLASLDPICISDTEFDNTEFEACKEFKDLQRKYHNGEDIGPYAGYFNQFSCTTTKPTKPKWNRKKRKMPFARKPRPVEKEPKNSVEIPYNHYKDDPIIPSNYFNVQWEHARGWTFM